MKWRTRLGGALQQVPSLAGVVPVILQRIGHRFGDDGVGGEVQDRLHLILAEDMPDQLGIAGIALDQVPVQHRFPKAGR